MQKIRSIRKVYKCLPLMMVSVQLMNTQKNRSHEQQGDPWVNSWPMTLMTLHAASPFASLDLDPGQVGRRFQEVQGTKVEKFWMSRNSIYRWIWSTLSKTSFWHQDPWQWCIDLLGLKRLKCEPQCKCREVELPVTEGSWHVLLKMHATLCCNVM